MFINGGKCDVDPRVDKALSIRPACYLERWWSTFNFETAGTGIYTAPNNEVFTAKLNDQNAQGFGAGFVLDYPETNMELQGQLQYDALIRQIGIRIQTVTPALADVLDFEDNFARNTALSIRKNKKSDNFIAGTLDDYLRGPDRARALGVNLAAPGSRSLNWSNAPGMHDLCIPVRVLKSETFSVKLYMPRGINIGVGAVFNWRVQVVISVQNLEDLG